MANLERERKALEPWTALVLVICIIGAINWGLVGFFNWNLVNAIFGGTVRGTAGTVSRIIYAIVGVCGVLLAVLYPTLRSRTTRLVEPGARRPIEAR